MKTKDRIIVALDVDTVEEAINLILELGDSVGMYKVGLQLITRSGPETFARIVQKHSNAKFFYDAKFNDIPNTVAKACRNASQLPGIQFMSVHASAGIEAMREAAKAADPAQVLAITALTSLSDAECDAIFGSDSDPEPGQAVPAIYQPSIGRSIAVEKFAKFSTVAGVGGIVCSPKELKMLREKGIAKSLVKVVPGIRPQWAVANDQKSFDTPAEAIRNGADYLVIGRPITQPPSALGGPVAAVHSIVREMELATKN